jgi:hypothetical protein
MAPQLRVSAIMDRIAFPRPALIIGTVLIMIWMAAIAAGLVWVYVADEYMTPAFSEQSFPQPRLY